MLLIALRGASLVACMSAFGTLLFNALILRVPTLPPSLRRLTLISLLLGSLLTLAWLLVQAEAMADADSLADILAAVPVVAFDTEFGHVVLIRLACLGATILLLPRLRKLPLLTSAAAVALQAGTAHAFARFAVDGPGLLISEVFHLLAAGAWLGSLIPLAISAAPLQAAASGRLLRAFSPLGLACVLVIAGTGLLQSSELIGSFADLADSDYGHLALAKLTIFAALLLVAGLNRFALLTQKRMLRVSLSVEILLGGLVILAAARLASTAPPYE